MGASAALRDRLEGGASLVELISALERAFGGLPHPLCQVPHAWKRKLKPLLRGVASDALFPLPFWTFPAEQLETRRAIAMRWCNLQIAALNWLHAGCRWELPWLAPSSLQLRVVARMLDEMSASS